MKIVIDGYENFDPGDFEGAIVTTDFETSDDEIITLKGGKERYEAQIKLTRGSMILSDGTFVPCRFVEE